MNSRVQMLALVGLVALIVGFAGSGTAWAQDVVPDDGLVGVVKDCRPCLGDVPDVNVGVDKDLEVLVGWSMWALIPGVEDDGDRHSARADLTFVVDFSNFRVKDQDERGKPVERSAVGVTIHVETLGPTDVTLIDEAVLFTSVDADTMKRAILTNLSGGLPPSDDEVKASQLLNRVTYTFKPTFVLVHRTGFMCGTEGINATYPATPVAARRGRVTLVGPIVGNP